MIETVTLAGGCFWCTEAIFTRINGVESVIPGYAGGQKKDPTYEEVASGKTGHAEAIQITFDPAFISFDRLLDVFWATHDPTTLNQQGNDRGTQYRSVIFHDGEAQRMIAEKSKASLASSGEYNKPIVTEITPFTNFYKAEKYHRNYFENHSDAAYCSLVVAPKIKKLLDHFGTELKGEYQEEKF